MGMSYGLKIWDTAGQERYHSLAPMYYRSAKIALIVFDITSQTSFECAKNWVAELQLSLSHDALMILIANKSDLESQRQVTYSESHDYAYENGLDYYETSATDSKNITNVFNTIASKIEIREEDHVKKTSLDLARPPKKRT